MASLALREQKAALSGTLKQDFQKDLELFKYFLLLLNNSSPIRNVELMWVDELDSLKPVFKERVNTADALVQLQPGGSALSNRNSPSTLFCDLVHGFGAHEKETCARSDVPAKQRCRATECSQVYPCHVGLTDIAVPVICDGEYLGTLFSGQVLAQPPTPEGFELVRKALAGHEHIDIAQLDAAYYKVPVVTTAQLTEMVRVLELFARYIANSWKRLQIMSNFQRVQSREMALNRKELAALLLSGEVVDPEELKTLAVNVNLRRLPDRVLVLRMKHGPEASETGPQIAHHIALNRISHIVESLCQNWPNTLSIPVRHGELCIFTGQESRNASHQRISLQERAEAILTTVRAYGISGARIGISGESAKPQELLRAYHEASAALEGRTESVCFFEEILAMETRPAQSLARVTKAIQQGEKVDAAVREFLARAMPPTGSIDHLHQSRALLTWATEHLSLEVISLGIESRAVTIRKERVVGEILNTSNRFAFCESFRQFAEFLAQQVATTFSQRESKIVQEVSRLVESRGIAGVTIRYLADQLHLSSGHLSRVYSRATGMTLEEYLIRQRIEMAKRTLLDPRLNVGEVSERCGFCNPAYFASVFKKYVHCTPREFASQPSIWKPLSPSIAQQQYAQSRRRSPGNQDCCIAHNRKITNP
jgi:AraC-like DNA-binding protein/ligand-binding sensor protein